MGSGWPGHACCWARLHLVVELGVHLGVHLVDDIDSGRVVDQEEADLLQALLLCHVLSLGERFQEVGFVGRCIQRCLEMGKRRESGVRGAWPTRPGTGGGGSGRARPRGPCWAGAALSVALEGEGKGKG